MWGRVWESADIFRSKERSASKNVWEILLQLTHTFVTLARELPEPIHEAIFSVVRFLNPPTKLPFRLCASWTHPRSYPFGCALPEPIHEAIFSVVRFLNPSTKLSFRLCASWTRPRSCLFGCALPEPIHVATFSVARFLNPSTKLPFPLCAKLHSTTSLPS